MRRALGLLLVTVLALAAAACDEPEPTWAYKLATLNAGDEDRPDRTTARAAAEAEFQRVLDCMLASYPDETEESVSDTLYAAWDLSAKDVTLLEWGRAICPP